MLRALKALHANDGATSVNAMPQDLYNDLLHQFGSIYRARQAAGLPAPDLRHWTLDAVLAELRRLHRTGLPIRTADLELAGRADLVGAALRYAGGLVRARRLAKVPDPPTRLVLAIERWDEDRVVEDIFELHRAGESLAMSRAPTKLVAAGIRYFGSWQAAIEVAGFDYDTIRLKRKPYTRDEIIAQLRELKRTHPGMTMSELHRLPIGSGVRCEFSSLAKALAAAKIRGWPKRQTQAVMSRKEVRVALRARHTAGKPMTLTAIQREDSRLALAIRRHYLAIAPAVAAAGLESESPVTWTREEVLRQLEARHRAGKPMTAAAVSREAQMLYIKARAYFGSYYAVAGRFGAKPLHRSWSRDEVIRELRQLARGTRTKPYPALRPALQFACRQYFGSVAKAKAAAGI